MSVTAINGDLNILGALAALYDVQFFSLVNVTGHIIIRVRYSWLSTYPRVIVYVLDSSSQPRVLHLSRLV